MPLSFSNLRVMVRVGSRQMETQTYHVSSFLNRSSSSVSCKYRICSTLPFLVMTICTMHVIDYFINISKQRRGRHCPRRPSFPFEQKKQHKDPLMCLNTIIKIMVNYKKTHGTICITIAMKQQMPIARRNSSFYRVSHTCIAHYP